MDWKSIGISAVSSTAAITALGYILRKWIETRLNASIKAEYDRSLEELKSDLRKKEAEFNADLRKHESQIDALQSGALSIASKQNELLLIKKFEAVETLWNAVVEMAPQKTAAKLMQSVNFDYAIDHAPSDPNIQEMFMLINNSLRIMPENTAKKNITAARLHLSDVTWAMYIAYSQVIMFAVSKIKMLEIGYDGSKLFKTDEIIEMVKAALPHQSKLIEKYGISSLDFLVDELEEKVFSLLRSEIQGPEIAMSGSDRSAKVMAHSRKTQVDQAAQQVSARDALMGTRDR